MLPALHRRAKTSSKLSKNTLQGDEGGVRDRQTKKLHFKKMWIAAI